MNDDVQEVYDIAKALLQWLESQEISRALGSVAMAQVVGAHIGYLATDKKSMEEGIDVYMQVIRCLAQINFDAREQ